MNNPNLPDKPDAQTPCVQRMVGPADVKYIKHCACCGKFLKQHRWMIVGGYDYNQNKRPICWGCDASYE